MSKFEYLKLADTIAAQGVTTQRVYTGSSPSASAIAAAVTAAQNSDDVVVTTDNAWGDTGQQSLNRRLHRLIITRSCAQRGALTRTHRGFFHENSHHTGGNSSHQRGIAAGIRAARRPKKHTTERNGSQNRSMKGRHR